MADRLDAERVRANLERVRERIAAAGRDPGEVTGDDLVAAGVPQSPAIGDALEETLRRKLDGEVSGREAELALALAIARGDAG